ncbi:DUF2530 domain-containing protein [Planomonospora sp. ID82291]|uniref:DUF2530 domain-containing protein n=1 Tax=Planomonospora sp. ID82291 TaxID=2738136 RepID=UPI0027DD588E|nr:DUF2530 domain-containing protein [Planomonospora sp. ID82291]
MNQPRRQDLQPLKTNDTATILMGMVLWAIALVVLLLLGPDPQDRWWIWTCVSGLVLGVFGLWYVRPRHHPAPLPAAEEPLEPATAVPPASHMPSVPGAEPVGPAEPTAGIPGAEPVGPAEPTAGVPGAEPESTGASEDSGRPLTG